MIAATRILLSFLTNRRCLFERRIEARELVPPAIRKELDPSLSFRLRTRLVLLTVATRTLESVSSRRVPAQPPNSELGHESNKRTDPLGRTRSAVLTTPMLGALLSTGSPGDWVPPEKGIGELST